MTLIPVFASFLFETVQNRKGLYINSKMSIVLPRSYTAQALQLDGQLLTLPVKMVLDLQVLLLRILSNRRQNTTGH